MLKVDEETLIKAHKSIEKLSVLLSACHNGAKLKSAEVGKALREGAVTNETLKKYLSLDS